MQRALLQYYLPQNHDLVEQALRRCGRYDLIGTGPQALVRPSPKTANSRPSPKGQSKGGSKAYAGAKGKQKRR